MTRNVTRIVEVVVFKFCGGLPRYLLLRRSLEEPLYPGAWQIITGTIREGETSLQAAAREFAEETGLRSAAVWIVPHISSFYDARRDEVNHSPFFAVQVGVDDEPRLSGEHSEYAWLSVSEANDRLVWPGQRHGLQIVNDVIAAGGAAAAFAATSFPPVA